MNDAKFIVVQDVDTAIKLISAGFQIVSQVNDIFTFINVIPKNFTFGSIDIKKLAYTNILTF